MDQLKKIYDGKRIQDIESEADLANATSLDQRKVFISILYYLSFTGRFRENKRFKDSTFDDYIESRFYLKPSRFRDEVWAFFKYPVETEKYGVGTMANIRHKVYQSDVPKVLDKIGKVSDKKKVITPEIISEAVMEFKRPEPETKPIDNTDYKAKYDDSVSTIRAMRAEIAERDLQIEKLKASLKHYKDECSRMNALLNPIFNYKPKENIKTV